mmetsp:Transcript_1906/g.6989  ORF Transcript_1906/g.6989 Transcript_1906/m.6989 type:complete len:233 (-) Transcript_1906:503-1201(-)
MRSRMSSVPKQTPSRSARKTCPREWRSVSPASAPRLRPSTYGVRFPWKCSRASSPSHPICTASASALSSSYETLPPSISRLNHDTTDPVEVCPPSMMCVPGKSPSLYVPKRPAAEPAPAVTPKWRCDDPVSSASCPGLMQPRPIMPMKASAPPWATMVPGARPPKCAAAPSLNPPPMLAPSGSTSCGHFPASASSPSAESIDSGGPASGPAPKCQRTATLFALATISAPPVR